MSNRRRSERILTNLDVGFRASGRAEKTRTANVSLHGLAVFTHTPLPLKQFVDLQLSLPGSFGQGNHSLNITAQVVRVVDNLKDKSGLVHRGICFDFHSFPGETRSLWRRFVRSLNGGARNEPSDPPANAAENDLIAFIVRPPDIPRMWAFYEFELGRGRSKVESPRGLPELSDVELVLIHPETKSEWVFTGTVLSAAPKGSTDLVILEVGLNDITPQRKEAFERFIRSGSIEAVRGSTTPPPPPKGALPNPSSSQSPKKRRPTFASFFDEFAEADDETPSDGEQE